MATTTGRGELWPEFDAFWARFLEEARRPGTVLVVEGERDRRALRRLGVEGRIVMVHHGRTLSGVAHELAGGAGRVVVLTDWDSEGGRLAQRLKEFLQAMPLELDVDTRRRLARILRGELVHVEGLAGWARRTSESLGIPFDQWLASLDGDVARAGRPTE